VSGRSARTRLRRPVGLFRSDSPSLGSLGGFLIRDRTVRFTVQTLWGKSEVVGGTNIFGLGGCSVRDDKGAINSVLVLDEYIGIHIRGLDALDHGRRSSGDVPTNLNPEHSNQRWCAQSNSIFYTDHCR